MKKSSLTRDQRELLETCQSVNFGRIENLVVQGGRPLFDPPPSDNAAANDAEIVYHA